MSFESTRSYVDVLISISFLVLESQGYGTIGRVRNGQFTHVRTVSGRSPICERRTLSGCRWKELVVP